MGDNESDKIQIELRRRNTKSYNVLFVNLIGGLAMVSRTFVVDFRHIFTVISMNGTFSPLYGIRSQHLDDMTYVMRFKLQPLKLTTKAYFSGHA